MSGHSSSTLRLSLAIVLALLVALAAGGGGPAQAADFTVTKTADTADGTCDADCSLREAIIAANALAGHDTITLPVGTYTQSIVGTDEDAAADGDLDITDDLTITGAGAGSTIIDGNGGVTDERVLHVDPGSTGVTVDISGVSIQNGLEEFGGGGIWNNGGLTLIGVTVSGNDAIGAGGIFNSVSGTLALTDSAVSGNEAGFDSGGIRNAGTLSLTDSTVGGNTAGTDAGGIRNTGTLMLTDSTVSGNTSGANGGGIYNTGSGGTLTLTGSTVSGNNADAWGGGISNSEGSIATLTNVTVSGNTADRGGGISNSGVELSATLQLNSSTLSSNTAVSDGGGVFNTDLGAVGLKNTIVAGNTAGPDCGGPAPITSNGNNIDSDGTCGLAAADDISSTDPDLGPLTDNGGPTQTHALLSGSPAIDAGSDDCPPPAADQRGVDRPIDGDGDGTATCDIGAYEFEPPPEPTPTPTPAATPTPAPTPTPVALAEVQQPAALPDTGGEPAPGGGRTLPLALIAAAFVLAGAGGTLVAVRRRR